LQAAGCYPSIQRELLNRNPFRGFLRGNFLGLKITTIPAPKIGALTLRLRPTVNLPSS
jgi:hypothetical protein